MSFPICFFFSRLSLQVVQVTQFNPSGSNFFFILFLDRNIFQFNVKIYFLKTRYQWLDIIFWAQNVFYYDPRCSATRCASSYYNMYPIIKVKKKKCILYKPKFKRPKKNLPKDPKKIIIGSGNHAQAICFSRGMGPGCLLGPWPIAWARAW